MTRRSAREIRVAISSTGSTCLLLNRARSVQNRRNRLVSKDGRTHVVGLQRQQY